MVDKNVDRLINNEALRDIVNRHVDTIAGSIFGLFFSSTKPEDVSFHDILNRIMLLVQAPITFVLCKKEKNIIRKIYNFNPHLFHQTDINHKLNEIIRDKEADVVINEGKLFCLFGSEYFLMVLLAINHNTKPSFSKDYNFIVLHPPGQPLS